MNCRKMKPIRWTPWRDDGISQWSGIDHLGHEWRIEHTESGYWPSEPADIYVTAYPGSRYTGMTLEAAQEWCRDTFQELIIDCFVQEDIA